MLSLAMRSVAVNADARFDLTSLWAEEDLSDWSNPWCVPAGTRYRPPNSWPGNGSAAATDAGSAGCRRLPSRWQKRASPS